MRTHPEAVSIYKTKHWVACQFSEDNECIDWAEQQFSFLPTEKERRLLDWSHYAEAIRNILNIK